MSLWKHPPNKTWETESSDDLRAIAFEVLPYLETRPLFLLFGDMGAGKTTFTHYLVNTGLSSPIVTSSPTFSYLHIYPCSPPIYHFDLYRMQNAQDFIGLGFDEYTQTERCVIEWPEKIWSLIPPEKSCIFQWSFLENDRRKVELFLC